MIIRIVRMTFQPECRAEFLLKFEMWRPRIASVKGCRSLKLLEDVDNPNVFCTFSEWDSQQDLDNYRKSDIFAEVWPLTKAMFADKPIAWSSRVI
jgi:quinol monooxygenase YgiN